ADEQITRIQGLTQQAVDKCLRGYFGKILIETQNPDGIDATRPFQQFQFGTQGADAAGRGFACEGGKKFFGLRFEDDGNDGQSARVGFEAEFLEDVFVSEVYAVKIAYGYGGPVRKVGRVVPPQPDSHCYVRVCGETGGHCKRYCGL
ncbi:hypothetical protein MM716_29335, partial [Klebsiella pneumoniae]|nr:hypothetical protein [Klebsiella pneumoniae]